MMMAKERQPIDKRVSMNELICRNEHAHTQCKSYKLDRSGCCALTPILTPLWPAVVTQHGQFILCTDDCVQSSCIDVSPTLEHRQTFTTQNPRKSAASSTLKAALRADNLWTRRLLTDTYQVAYCIQIWRNHA